MTFSGYIHTLSEKFVYVPQMSMDFVPKNRSLPPSGARDCARLCQIELLLLFSKERTADDDSVPCSVQCLESKRLRFTSDCFVLFCQCSCDSWFVFVFICVVCFEFGLGLSNVLVRYCSLLFYS